MAACRIIFESNAYVTKFFMGLSQKFSQQGTLNNSLIRQIIADRYEMSPRPTEVLCDSKSYFGKSNYIRFENDYKAALFNIQKDLMNRYYSRFS